MTADLDLDIAELDAEVARMRAKFPNIFNVSPPAALPTTKDQEDHSAAALPFVNSIFKDEE